MFNFHASAFFFILYIFTFGFYVSSKNCVVIILYWLTTGKAACVRRVKKRIKCLKYLTETTLFGAKRLSETVST